MNNCMKHEQLFLGDFAESFFRNGLSREISTGGTIDNIFILITSTYFIVLKTFVNKHFPVQLKKIIKHPSKDKA